MALIGKSVFALQNFVLARWPVDTATGNTQKQNNSEVTMTVHNSDSTLVI